MGRRGNKEGNIRRRADGYWEARLTLEDGRRKSIYGKKREEVASKLAAAIRDRDKGLPAVRDERQTIETWLTSWLERVKSTIRSSTWTRYRQLLSHAIKKLGKVPISRITPQQVETLYAAKLEEGLSSTTVHHLHTVLHHALDDALRKGLVQRNVAELVNVPKMREHEIHPLTREQAHTLLEAAHSERLEALYVLALATGMREGELLALHWRDVDLDSKTLQVRYSVRHTREGFAFTEPKTKQSRRKIVLNTPTVETLRAHRARQLAERMALGPEWRDQDLVFTTPTGEPLDAVNMVRGAFHPLLKRAGLPRIRFHDLRHTAATLMLLQGVPAKIVSEMLGHASIAITLDVYSHVLPSMQKDAAAAMEAVLWG